MNSIDILKKIFLFYGLFISSILFGQSKEDIENLRTEILLKITNNQEDVHTYLNYYAKKSALEASFLSIKKELIKGNFSSSIDKLYKQKDAVEKQKNTLIQFQYDWLLLQIQYLLGIESKFQINSNLSEEKIKLLIDLTINKKSFSLIDPKTRKKILEKGIQINNNQYSKNFYSLSQLYYYLGDYYNSKTEKDSSIYYFEKSNELINKNKLPLHLTIYNNLELAKISAQVNITETLIQKSQIYVNKSSDIFYNIDYYSFKNKIAVNKKDFSTVQFVYPIMIDLLSSIQDRKMKGRAILMDKMTVENQKKIEQNKQIWPFIYLIFSVIIIFFFLFIYLKKKKNQSSKIAEGDHIIKNFNISDKTEEKILLKLLDFEQKQKYIQKNISLKSLATQFETNPRYISEIINKNKQTNFSNYINDLRIDYIVDKLKSNPEYRKYKVSYLAEACGFSSHSLFTTVFKNKMGVSPIEFIQKLKNDE